LPEEKVDVLVPSPRLRRNREQVWRFAIHAAVLRVPQLSDPNMKIKAVLSGQLANERRPTSQAVKYLQEPFAILDNRSVEGVCVILSVKKSDVHGCIPS